MTALALTMLAANIVSIAAVQLCASWLRRWTGARIAYACWLLPWLGVVASLLPAGAASAIAPPGSLAGILSAPVIALAARLVAAPASQFALLAWAAIAVLFFAAQLGAYRAFVRNASRQTVDLGRVGVARILGGPNIAFPVAAGILRPRIFLPADFDTAFSPDEQRMILRHEQTHHDRHDIAANLAGLAMLSLHWWNPLAYRAHRRFRADQELACDATAIAGLGRADRHAYATAILKCAGRPHAGLAAAMSGRTEAAARLSAIASDVPLTLRPTLPAVLAVAVLGSLILVEAVVTRALPSALPALAVATRTSPSPAFAPSIGSSADPCEDAWRPPPATPRLVSDRQGNAPPVRLILASQAERRFVRAI